MRKALGTMPSTLKAAQLGVSDYDLDHYYEESARLALRVVQSGFSACSQFPVNFLYKGWIAVLLRDRAFHTCPSLSWRCLALRHRSKPISGLGGLGGFIFLCCSSLLIALPASSHLGSVCGLPGEEQVPVTPCLGRGVGACPFCCAGLAGAGRGAGRGVVAGLGSRTPLGVAVSVYLLSC